MTKPRSWPAPRPRTWSSSAVIRASAGSVRPSTTRCPWKASSASPTSCAGSQRTEVRGQPTVVMSNSLPSGSRTVRHRYSSRVCSPPGHDPPRSPAVLLECLPPARPRPAQFDDPSGRRVEVVDLEVQVHAVLRRLRFGHALQAEGWEVLATTDEHVSPLVDRLTGRTLEQGYPERRHTIDVNAVQRDEGEP